MTMAPVFVDSDVIELRRDVRRELAALRHDYEREILRRWGHYLPFATSRRGDIGHEDYYAPMYAATTGVGMRIAHDVGRNGTTPVWSAGGAASADGRATTGTPLEDVFGGDHDAFADAVDLFGRVSAIAQAAGEWRIGTGGDLPRQLADEIAVRLGLGPESVALLAPGAPADVAAVAAAEHDAIVSAYEHDWHAWTSELAADDDAADDGTPWALLLADAADYGAPGPVVEDPAPVVLVADPVPVADPVAPSTGPVADRWSAPLNAVEATYELGRRAHNRAGRWHTGFCPAPARNRAAADAKAYELAAAAQGAPLAPVTYPNNAGANT